MVALNYVTTKKLLVRFYAKIYIKYILIILLMIILINNDLQNSIHHNKVQNIVVSSIFLGSLFTIALLVIIMFFAKFIKSNPITKETFTMNKDFFTMTTVSKDNITHHRIKLTSVKKVYRIKNGLVLYAQNTYFLISEGVFESGSMREIIQTLRAVPSIRFANF